MSAAVVTRKLTRAYKNTVAVDGIDVSIPEGVCCGFLGKNGAGKTTTLKMLAGLIRPTSGSVELFGRETAFGRPAGTAFGYLPDVPSFYGYMDGREFLLLCGRICGMEKKELDARAAELLKLVGLDKSRARISGYSRGMKQRLGIAQALLDRPRLVLMDEPISALDPIGRRDVSEIIKQAKDATIILSTHILSDVEDICDHVLVIDGGKILAQDYLAALKEKHSAGAVKIRMGDEAGAARLGDALKSQGFELAAGQGPAETVARLPGRDSAEAGRMALAALHLLGAPCISFGRHEPNLEDVFFEVLRDA